jgi:Polysulphide reductase, NrfD.
MESIILMNSKWGNDIFVPMYLFFGGLSGGLFVIAVAADLLGIKFKQFENFSRLTSYLVLPVLALAGAFIAFHLGQTQKEEYCPFFLQEL